MKATMLYGPRDVRFEERDDPKITQPTDAIIRIKPAPPELLCHRHAARIS
jgi:threonine dehydrogenase-like Zn-dependent dehydrogenase